VFDAELATGLGKGQRVGAETVVGHDALEPHAAPTLFLPLTTPVERTVFEKLLLRHHLPQSRDGNQHDRLGRVIHRESKPAK